MKKEISINTAAEQTGKIKLMTRLYDLASRLKCLSYLLSIPIPSLVCILSLHIYHDMLGGNGDLNILKESITHLYQKGELK